MFSLYSIFAPITADEGIPINGSLILLQGKDIYKDLIKVEGPVTFLINLPILYFFPQNLLFPRLFTSLIVSFSFLFIFLLSIEILDKKFSLLFIFLFTISTLILNIIVPSHRWYSFILCIFSVYLILNFIKYNNFIFLFLSGFLAGLNLLTMINNGLFNFLSLSFFFLIKYRKDFFEIFIKFLCGFLIPLLLFLLYAFLKGILIDYFYSVYIYIIKGGYLKGQYIFYNFWYTYFRFFKDFFLEIIRFEINLVYRDFIKFFINVIQPLIYFISFINLKSEKNSYYFLFFITGFFQFVSGCIQGPDSLRWLFSLAMVYLLMFYFIEKIYKTKRKLIYFFILFLFYFPLKFITHTEFIIKGKEFYSEKRFWVFVSREWKKGFEEIKDFLEKNKVGKSDIFVLTFDFGPILYFLYDKEIPVKYDVILPYLLPLELEIEVVETLRFKKIKYVLITKSDRSMPRVKHWNKSYIFNFTIENFEKVKVIDFGGDIILEIYRFKGI
ncbi:MAG: hypothetical protein ABIN20_02255 [candidate division WOR-3 bacterium]